jgi:hypothetical protein
MILALITLGATPLNTLLHPSEKNVLYQATGSAYCSLKLEWDYTNGTVDLPMPGYIKAALHKYQHPAPTRHEHALHQWKKTDL